MLGVFRDHAETRQEFLSANRHARRDQRGERFGLIRRRSDLVGQRAIRQRFGQMHRADFVGAVEIGESCALPAVHDDTAAA